MLVLHRSCGRIRLACYLSLPLAASLLPATVLRAETTTAPPGASGTLTVQVSNATTAQGDLMLMVCPAADFLSARCTIRRRIRQVVFPTSEIFQLPPGRYAVQGFLDTDGNGDLDRSFLGLPQEPMGFSNNVSLRRGKPRFAAAAVEVTAGASPSTPLRLEDLF